MKYYYKMTNENGEFLGLCESSDEPLSDFGDAYVEISQDEYLKIQDKEGIS